MNKSRENLLEILAAAVLALGVISGVVALSQGLGPILAGASLLGGIVIFAMLRVAAGLSITVKEILERLDRDR